MIEQVCLNKVLIESAKEVFETMVFMDLAEATEPDQKIEDWTLLGSITFKGDLEGCLAFCCNALCAKAIAMNMLGIDTTEQLSEDDTCDAIGEIVNMVMGSVKSRLPDNVGDISVSIPSVVRGRELCNSLGDDSEKILIKINIEDEYVAELSLLYRESGGE